MPKISSVVPYDTWELRLARTNNDAEANSVVSEFYRVYNGFPTKTLFEFVDAYCSYGHGFTRNIGNTFWSLLYMYNSELGIILQKLLAHGARLSHHYIYYFIDISKSQHKVCLESEISSDIISGLLPMVVARNVSIYADIEETYYISSSIEFM